jgi:hypothetical protein
VAEEEDGGTTRRETTTARRATADCDTTPATATAALARRARKGGTVRALLECILKVPASDAAMSRWDSKALSNAKKQKS